MIPFMWVVVIEIDSENVDVCLVATEKLAPAQLYLLRKLETHELIVFYM